MIEEFFEYKDNTKEAFIPLPSAHNPRVLLPLRNKFYVRKSFQIHNTASLINRLFRTLFIETYPLGIWIQKEKLYAKPILIELIDFVKEKIKFSDHPIVSAYSGSPGRNRKITLQFMSSYGEIIGYMKIGKNPDNRRFIQNEFEMTKKVKKKFQTLHIPENVFLEEWRSYLLLYQKSFPGPLYSIKNTLNSELLSSLIELAHVRPNYQAWKVELQALMQKIFSHFDDIFINKIKDRIKKTMNQLENENYFTCLTHGDFVSYNIKKTNKSLYVYDWEYAEEQGFPFYDIFHFIYQGMFQIRKMDVKKIITKYILNHKLNKTYFKLYADALSIKKEDILKFFLLYLVKSACFDLWNRPDQNINENHYVQGIHFMVRNVL